MKKLFALVVSIFVFQNIATAQFPDPYPLEQRVARLEDRVAALEGKAGTIGVKVNQFSTYSELRDYVKAGNYGTLAVGVNQPADLTVPSGFMGFSDGVHSLFPGEPMMVKRFGPSAIGAQTVFPKAQAGTHSHVKTDGTIITHSDSNFGNAAAHEGVPYPWYKTAVTTQTVFQNTDSCPASGCPATQTSVRGNTRILPNFRPFNGTFR